MNRVVFIDIDGTLRNDKGEITQRTKNSIKKATQAGILVVICSGRPRNSTEEISKECKASPYVIASNGSQVYNYQDNKMLYRNPMKKEACVELYQLAIKNDMIFVMNLEEGRVASKVRENSSEQLLVGPIEKFLEQNEVVQCLFIDSDFEKVKRMKQEIEKVEGVAIRNCSKSLTNPSIEPRETSYYDIADIHTLKGNGIKEFCHRMNIDLKDTIAIGDDFNDVSMFETAGYSVVMGNAHESIKKNYADEVTKTNNEEGVAVFLEKLVENQVF